MAKKRTYEGVFNALQQISKDENIDFGLDGYTAETFKQKYFTGPGNIDNLYNKLNQITERENIDFGQGTRDEWLESFGYKRSAEEGKYETLDNVRIGGKTDVDRFNASKPKPQQPQGQTKPQQASEPSNPSTVVPTVAEAPQVKVTGTPWGTAGSGTGQSRTYKPFAPGQVRSTEQVDATQLGVPYKPDTQMTAAERDKVYRENDFSVQQLQKMQREEKRRSQPLVDTGSPEANKHIVRTQGEWEDDVQKGVNRITNSVVVPAVDKAIAEFDKRASEVFNQGREKTNATGSLPTGSAGGFGILGNVRESNEAKDPEKILNYLQQQMEGLYKDSAFAEEVGKEADRMGIDRGEYIEKIIKPKIQQDLADRLTDTLVKRELPRSATEYIMNGLSNSIVGMLYNTVTESKGQRQIKNQAEAMTEEGLNPHYNPGTGAKLAQMGVSFAADAPFFGLYGKVSGQVAKNVAERQISNMMAKGLSESAARSIVGAALENSVGARMKNYLMQHVISSSLTMGGYNATSEAARQMRDSEFDPMRLAGSTAEGLATGAAFGVTGAVSQALSQPLTGISRVGAKAAGFAAEAETMYATEELAKMAQGEEGFTNPFEGSLEAMEKLGVMKASGGHLLTKAFETGADIYKNGVRQAIGKAMSPKQTGMKFTKEEEAYVRDTAEGRSLMETLSNMHPDAAFSEVNGKKKLTPEGEQMRRQLADNYNAFMGNTEIPAVVKQKVAGVLGGVYRPGLETGADIVHNADGSVIVKTRDKDGNCVRDLKFDTFSDAEQWREQCQDEFRLNDAVNMWNGTSQEQRAAVVREIAGINGISAKDAAGLVHKALDSKDTSLDRDQYNNVYDVIARNAFPEDEYNPKRRFEEGRKITPEERHFALADAQVKEEQLALYGQEFSDEVMVAAEYPDEKMAELAMRKDVSGPMLNAAKEYYNANARMQGMMEEAMKGVDEQVEAANAEVRRNTHPDSGMLISGSSRGRDVYVTAGHFQITPEGKLVSTDNSGAVIVRDMNTGEIDVINPNDVVVTGVTDPRRLIEANDSMDGLRGQLMKAADDSIEFAPGTPETPQEMGEVFTGADGKMYMVTGEADQAGNVAWMKLELDESGNPVGEPQPLDIDEYRKSKSNEIDTANRPQDEVVPGNAEMGTDVNESVPEGQRNGQINPSETPAESVQEPENQQEGKGKETEQQSVSSRIPVDEKGKKVYEKATPEDTLAELTEKYGEEKANQMIAKIAESAARELDKLEQTDISSITDMADLEVHEDRLTEARKKAKYWQDLVTRKQEADARMAEAVVTHTANILKAKDLDQLEAAYQAAKAAGVPENALSEVYNAKKSWINLVNPKEIRNFATDPESQAKWVDEHIDEIVDSYIKSHGNVLDPDEMRNAFAGIGYDGKNVPDFREQEKRVVRAAYDKMLQNAVGSGNSSITLLTGVGGAGKSTATRNMDLSNRGLVYDSAFNDFKSLKRVIDRAKELGMTDIQVIAVYNDAYTAFSNTVNRGLNTGRFLALDYFVDAFHRNQGKIAQLRQEYPDVEIISFDNSGNKAAERPEGGRISADEAEKWDYVINDAKLNELLDILENGINEGRFTEDQAASIGRGLRDVTRRVGDIRPETVERVTRIGRRIRQEDVGDLRSGVSGEQRGSGRGDVVPPADGEVQGSSEERPAEGDTGASGETPAAEAGTHEEAGNGRPDSRPVSGSSDNGPEPPAAGSGTAIPATESGGTGGARTGLSADDGGAGSVTGGTSGEGSSGRGRGAEAKAGAGKQEISPAKKKVYQKTVEASRGRKFTVTLGNGNRSVITIDRIDHNGNVVLTRQDYDPQGNPIGEPRQERHPLEMVGRAIVESKWNKELTTEEKLRGKYKFKVGDVPVLDVLTESEQQQILDAIERGDKEAVGNLTGDFIQEHRNDIILRGRDQRNQRVEKAFARGSRAERLDGVRNQYNGFDNAKAMLDNDSMQPQSIEEYVADALGDVPKPGNGFLAYESYDQGGNTIVGMKDESGFGSRGFNGDTKGFNPWLAPKGKGKSLKQFAESVHESLPEGMKEQYSDQDIRDIIYNILTGAEKPTDIANYILRNRVKEAEAEARHEEDGWMEEPGYQKWVEKVGLTDMYEHKVEQGNPAFDSALQKLDQREISIDDPDLLKEYGLKNVTLSRLGDHVTLTHFVVDNQGQGNGTRFMEDLARLADEKGWTLDLTPDTSFGATSIKRLKDFYKRFGFKDNKGRNTDFFTRESMVRRPKDWQPMIPEQQEKALRDAVVEHLRQAGIEVSTDWKEGQRILDDYNSRMAVEDPEAVVKPQKVTDEAELEELNSGKTVKRYRAMQLIDGKLYPPMSAKVDGEMREPTEIGVWEKAEERPDLVKNGKFVLNKGQKGQGNVPAAYNPYFHTSTSGLNDQFTSAYKRPELVVVEVEIPESELTSGYKAEGAKDAVGNVDWHSGVVNGQLPADRQRQVTLSRYSKVNRIVPDSEVADMIAKQLEGTDIEVPYNVVTPAQRAELEKRGVKIGAKPAGSVTEDINGNPIRQQKTDEPMLFKTKDGHAYGYTYKGKIYLDPRIAMSETPVHEYGHLWAEMKRQTSPEEWNDIKRVMLTDKLVQPIIDRVKRDYPELSKEGREDDFIEEVITQFSGKRGAERLREIANEIAAENGGIFGKAEAVTAMQRLKNILNRFWEGVAKMMGWKYRNANQIADRILADMLNDVDPTEKIKAEKLEMKPQKEDTAARDKEYADAVAAGDKEKVDAMLREEAARKGYDENSDYQGTTAFNGSAPSKNDYFDTKEERKEAFENGNYDGTASLGDFMDSGIDLGNLDWTIHDWRGYHTASSAGKESIMNLRNTVDGKKKTITMYRSVPSSVKENSFRNGDWVTPSLQYAKDNAAVHGWGRKYRIIEQEVPVDDIWWDNNDINEWGYDDGKGYAYKNTRNNRKMMEPTYDDKGNLIPLSKRFNDRNADIRFQMVGKKGAAEADKAELFPQRTEDMNLAEEMEKAGKDTKAIKMATGWERGADGQWRYEIPDTDADILSKYNKKLDEAKARGIKEPTVITNLEDLLGEGSELFKYYPNLRKMAVIFSNYLPDGTSGLYDGANIELNAKEASRFEGEDLNNENIYGTLLHEIQHAVQDIEGFAKGGNMQTATTKEGIDAIINKKTAEKERILQEIEAERKILSSEEELDLAAQLDGRTIEDERKHINDEIDELAQTYDNLTAQIDRIREKGVVSMTDAKDLYHRLAGEVESRNVTERMDMTPEERRNSLASDTEDVKREDQVIIMDDGTSMNINDIKPIGTNRFGGIYDQFKGKVKEAFDFLTKKKEGYLTGVFHRDDLGDIDLAWGSAPTDYTGKGLAHIIRKHIKVLKDFKDVDEAMRIIDDVVTNGTSKPNSDPKLVDIEKGDYRVVVAKNDEGNWILSAFDFVKPKKEKEKTLPPSKTPGQSDVEAGAVTSNLSLSEGKVTNNSSNNQENQQKSSPIGKTSSPEAVQAEESRVNTSPTDAQKEAGNYQKGHINIDGYDITIENPKGSVRSGVDSKGNRWESTMHNTYGYIRGTEGVDGDHIDVFLSDNPASGNVYVIDQVNPNTGEFDEHKVMYGFASEEEARQAYLSNYGEGWKGLGNITEVTRENFKKWIESSHHKTKPFAEYKSVKANEPRFQRVGSPEPEMTPEERQYWNKWDADIKKWRERNAIEETATGPSEKPKMQQGESALDYAKRLVQWNREKSLWQTAPKLEDYRQRREDKDVLEAARENEKRYPDSPSAKMRRVAAEFQQIRRAMSQQKAYDKATVKAVTDFAQEFMKMGFGDNLSRGEMERMLSSVKNATGAKDIKRDIDNIMNILVDNQLRNLDQRVTKLSSVKELSKTAQGVEKQGRLELKGQRMIQAFRQAREGRMDAAKIRERMNEVAEKMARNDEEAPMWEQEYEGLSIALQYQENIEASRDEYADLDRAYKAAVESYKGSGRSYKAQQELLEAIDQAMAENKIERIGLFGDIIGRLEGNINESMKGAREFVERDKERVKHIQQIANFDLAGKPADAMREKQKGKPANFFLQPLATFEQMLRQFGSRNANGEGHLYNYFMRSWIDSVDKSYVNEQKAKEELDAKAREVFGNKVKRWSDLYELERRLPTMEVEVLDGENPKTFTLNQGNLLYIYMADKMADGRMKLRNMGIDEEHVEAIKDFLDPRLKQLGDWLQDEYLPGKRTEYNKVHERMFGAPMAAIDNYFPLRILGDARYQEQDVNVPDAETLPSTITGNIIKRTKNTLPLDILHTDALSLAIEHVEDMERWAATAEWNRDVNTLLSHTTFRNKVKNMDTIYGSGDALWEAFKNTAKMAAGTYSPIAKTGGVDKAISNIAKGVTAAKINFRVYTAFKQILSAPAFLHDVNLGDFVKNSINPYGSWKWAMENMPVFRKRWKSRQVGDTRLMDDPTDWKMWKTNVVQMATRLGMSPNALVDGVTCAVGARSIYEARYKQYKDIGASDEVARKRALQDAEIGYNLTQQSSEGAFVSQIQKDRTVAANMLSVFRNSSMAYTRQWVDAARNLRHRAQKGYKEDSIKFMARQMQDQFGLEEDEARKAAEKEYARAARHDVARLLNMMFGVTTAWNIGASLPYLLMGDDDETKKEMLTDAAVRAMIAGPTEGLAAGNLFSEFISRTAASEETRKTISKEGWGAGIDAALKQGGDYEVNPLPLMADIQGMIKKMGYDKYAAAQDVFNICMQSAVGVNPQTFTDMWNACMDYGNPDWMPFTKDVGNDDLANSKEIALFIMRLMNAPTSSWRNKYIDELGMNVEDAKKLPYEEMARRYANYKHWKDAPVMGWLRGDAKRQEKMDKIRKQFDDAVYQRMERLSDKELMNNLARSESAEEKRRYAKIIAQRLGVAPVSGLTDKQDFDKNWYQHIYQERMQYDDIREEEMLDAKLKDYREKYAGDKTRAEVNKRLDWIRNGKYDTPSGRKGNRKKGNEPDLLAPGKKQFSTDGDEKANEAIMKNIRKWRKEALEILMRAESSK